ncbi:MAG TPA: molybdopterin-dependent oxidoreductase [Planctomycetaceae bacterium]|nr:molybdopterin-dependent oxidoreductase [Planctomycetaceae bacterium]
MPLHDRLSSRSTRRAFLGRTAAGAAAALLASSGRPRAEDSRAAAARIEKDLIVHETSPHNAEPALDKLVESWITPLEHFYVRSHGNTPEIDPREYRLSVEGLIERPLRMGLAELRERFQPASAVAALTCAGNRRREHSRTKPVGGVPWDAGAIGNARWAGAKLSDLLRAAGVRDGAKHVWLEGLDEIGHAGEIIPFGGSLPLARALADTGAAPGALLAWEMNEQPLAADHGFPLRAVVPGYIGARSVKWLGRIVVSDRPSPNHYVAEAYKLVTEGTPEELARTRPIYEYPLNAAICLPAEHTKLAAGTIRVRGYALPSGEPGRTISGVRVSADGGRSWMRAKITSPVREFCLVLWQAEVPVHAGVESLLVDAVESTGRSQPETTPWNQKGYLYDARHRVPVRVG